MTGDEEPPAASGPAEIDPGVLERFEDAVMPHDRRLTPGELIAEAGVDFDLALRLRRAMGLSNVPPGEAAYYDADIEALRRAKELSDATDLDAADLLHLTRALGQASARMARAVVEFWMERLATGREPPFDRGRIDSMERLIGYMFRRHLLDSAARQTRWIHGADEGVPVAVGFADLVGFTSLSEQIGEMETAELIERFEVIATDVVIGGGGRVVKMIGDEVMFSSEPADVGEIALGLTESFDAPELPSVRVGVASGAVVPLAGDLYGPVVNLASRATVAARPGTVLVSPALAEVLSEDPRYRVHALRPHRLKGIGPVQLSVLRRARGE